MAILTVAANGLVGTIHDRMPAILPGEAFDRWLDCTSGTAVGVLDLLRPAPEDLLEVLEVGTRVNDPRSEGPELQEPVRRLLL